MQPSIHVKITDLVLYETAQFTINHGLTLSPQINIDLTLVLHIGK